MSLIKKIKILKVAFKNTKYKSKILIKSWNAFRKGGLLGLKYAIMNVYEKQHGNTNNIDIYEYQENLLFKDVKANKSISVIIEVKDMYTDISATINSLNEQIYRNYKVILIVPIGYYSNLKLDKVYYYNLYPDEVYNEAIQGINSEYFIVINGSNIFNKNALLLFANMVQDKTRALVYCDESIFDGNNGHMIKHFIKPEYSQLYQLHSLYLEQGIMFSTEIVKKLVPVYSEHFSFSARINDLAMRAIHLSDFILHINRILLLRNSFSEDKKPFQNICVLNCELKRIGYTGTTLIKNDRYEVSIKSDYYEASIIIPTDDLSMAGNCIESIISKTDYPVYEIIIVSQHSICEKLKEKYSALKKISYVNYEGDFNYSRKCNLGAKEAIGDILLFLNDSVMIEQEDWLNNMVFCFNFEKIGAVSPKILRRDKTIRYAGIISGGFGFFPIPFNGEPDEFKDGLNELAFSNREVSILSATCLAVRKQLFESINGFNEKHTPLKFCNADLSFKIKDNGFVCCYCSKSIITAANGNWYDSWFDKDDKTAYIYILKNYIHKLNFDPYFTNEMKYQMLRNVPFDTAFYSGYNNNQKTGKTVLLVSHELSLTGAPIALHYAARAIKNTGNYPVVVSPYDGKLRDELLSDGIDVIIDSTINGSEFWLKWATNFDVIIVSTLVQYNNIVQLNNRDIPVIWWVHESRESYINGADNLIPSEIGNNIHVYCGGGYAKSVMKEYRPNYNIGELLYCVPDYSQNCNEKYNYLLENTEDNIVFAIIGTIEERKGQDIFAKAIMAMPKEYIKKCRFFIIGRKIHYAVYEEVNKLKNMYPDEVTLINEVSRAEIKDVYNQCDAIVCASRDDPMPVFMTECLMLSKIAICSENTGTASLLKDGLNGFVFKKNNFEELMEKMIYVIDNIENLSRVKIEGRKTYEKYFTQDAFDENLTNIINNINIINGEKK